MKHLSRDRLRTAWTVTTMLATAALFGGCGSSSAGTPAKHHDTNPSSSSAISRSFQVNGHDLFIECVGTGSPTMVLEVGEGRVRGDLAKIQDAYESRMRVCDYDRANKGGSAKAPTPRKGAAVVSDLHGLLQAAGIAGPYLLVGHSAGGLIVQAYAAAYPDEVAGVVAINPVAPWKQWAPVVAKMSPSERRSEIAFLTGANGESLDYRDIGRFQDRPVPTSIPSYLLISSPAECPPGNASCRRMIVQYDAAMKQVALQWGAPLKVVDASHDIQFDHLEAVTAAIDDVLGRVPSS